MGRYEVLLADEPESLAAHFRLRYQVYCLDKGYENPADFPDGMECDEHDAHAVHFVAYDRSSGQAMGAVRLILPEHPSFPCEQVGGFDAAALSGIARERCLELSRLCLPKTRKSGPRLVTEQGESSAASMLQSCEIAMTLYQAAYEFSLSQGITHWLGFTSPAMRRLLSSQKVRLEAIGAPLEHRGERQLYLIPCRFLAPQLGRFQRPAYRSAQQARQVCVSVA
ncbi:MAG: PEP-CTERM/exosortase system-associated acyltransferase [Gammaproteobacteria bacterium]|nr:PEP-CTERM/exosortase system-associated acyltransferase [Gammaproteobacteria bacterium]